MSVPAHRWYEEVGHGHGFVRRADGTREPLRPAGLPLGILPDETYQQHAITLDPGDVLVVYSDRLVEADPDRVLDPLMIDAKVDDTAGAPESVNRLVGMADLSGAPPDDLTVVVLRCRDQV